jgi:hypothetical protein
MKRAFALVLSLVALVSVCAACGDKNGGNGVTVAEYTTAAGDLGFQGNQTTEIPEGWFSFGTVVRDGVVQVNGLNELETVLGGTISVGDKDEVTPYLDDLTDSGKVTSINVRGNAISVLEVEENGQRKLYAKGGPLDKDADLTDTTTKGNHLKPPPTLPTTKRTTTTTKRTTLPPRASTVPTTARPNVTKDPFQEEKDKINNSNMSASEKKNALKMLSYQMDKNGVFYVEHEPWQKQFGFNQIYDIAAPMIQLIYGTVRIKFRYDYVYKLDDKGKVQRDLTGKPIYETDSRGNPIPKDWMIQMWKGRYGLIMLGGEVGIYTKPATQAAEHYNSAVAEEELIIAMDVYQANLQTGAKKHLFTRGPESAWWLTGFTPGSFHDETSPNKKSEIILVANIQFPSDDMLRLFCSGLSKAGFHSGSPGRDNPETYTTVGHSVKVAWQFLDES